MSVAIRRGVLAAIVLIGGFGWGSFGPGGASATTFDAAATGTVPVLAAVSRPSRPLLAAAAGGPRTAYTMNTAPLRRDPGGTVVGTLTPGTPVAVTETRGTDARVDVQGWSSGGGTAILVAVGQRVILATLSAPDQAQRQVGTQTKDSFGTVWTQVTISGWVAVSVLTADLQAVWTRGRQVYETHCSTCHSLYATEQYTVNQWPGVVQSMADRANLTGDDLPLVVKYLQTHAKTQ